MFLRLAVILLLSTVAVTAQTPFVEGTLTYNVSLQPANGQESLGTQAGTYTVTIKGTQVRRELKMNSGYHSIVLYDGRSNTGSLLQETPDQKYAVKLEPADMDKRRAPWAGYKLDESKNTETADGKTCRPGTIQYADGTRTDICLSETPLITTTWAFSRLPGLQAVPLRFQIRNKSGSLVYFKLESMTEEPVDASAFRIPAGYKILSAAELHDAGE